ncbi:hypothetical protein DPX39_010018100 [Trypanosoma brucei equiperdum]|uniref:Uncharacterized protein n=1 Tax=Trypanosoma brucei equiperdum TaxID=630700 RepID=A0A3L6LC23_9TRYP|nr:hypothetical protein DPX39_010018100 [Trypanosoma brucei equiperdum]
MYSLYYPHSSTSRRAKRKRNKRRRNVTLCFGFYLPPPPGFFALSLFSCIHVRYCVAGQNGVICLFVYLFSVKKFSLLHHL